MKACLTLMAIGLIGLADDPSGWFEITTGGIFGLGLGGVVSLYLGRQ